MLSDARSRSLRLPGTRRRRARPGVLPLDRRGKWHQDPERGPCPARRKKPGNASRPLRRPGHWMFCHWSLCESYWYPSRLVSGGGGARVAAGAWLVESRACGWGRVDGGGRSSPPQSDTLSGAQLSEEEEKGLSGRGVVAELGPCPGRTQPGPFRLLRMHRPGPCKPQPSRETSKAGADLAPCGALGLPCRPSPTPKPGPPQESRTLLCVPMEVLSRGDLAAVCSTSLRPSPLPAASWLDLPKPGAAGPRLLGAAQGLPLHLAWPGRGCGLPQTLPPCRCETCPCQPSAAPLCCPWFAAGLSRSPCPIPTMQLSFPAVGWQAVFRSQRSLGASHSRTLAGGHSCRHHTALSLGAPPWFTIKGPARMMVSCPAHSDTLPRCPRLGS